MRAPIRCCFDGVVGGGVAPTLCTLNLKATWDVPQVAFFASVEHFLGQPSFLSLSSSKPIATAR